MILKQDVCLCAGPPLEEHLAQSSLWPEIAKLYGHGAEIFCVAASPSGDMLASACKAQTSSTAAVWLWETATWAALGSMTAHSLTVTQLLFSPDGQLLLSVSRDRTAAVYRKGTGVLLARDLALLCTRGNTSLYCSVGLLEGSAHREATL